MKSMNKWQAALFFCLLFCLPLSAQKKAELDSLEGSANFFKAKVDSTRSIRLILMNEADIIARKIDLEQSQRTRSQSGHHQLEKQLQKSQELETRVKAAEDSIQAVSSRYFSAVRVLIQGYQDEINSLMAMAESDDGNREEKLSRVQALLEKKGSWEEQLSPEPGMTQTVFEVDAYPWDSPADLQMKGDLMLDQEDALRGEITKIDSRLHSLRDEERVRRKMTELAQEMDLFDEKEELMGKSLQMEASAYSSQTDGSNMSTESRAIDSRRTRLMDLAGSPLGDVLSSDYSSGSRNLPELQNGIKQLTWIRSVLLNRADSLHTRADWFFDLSGKSKK